ncbi:Urease accessory protein UreD [hydrothermal vent metagenome]|uniref:Urease accessory protein UreD n=1 Tax=hydrothermal vent metagenome TaxID=652676 RepID=A0A3B0ZYY7_9ZZZZ
MSAILQPSCWQASLALRFARRAGRTAIVHRKHFGPLRIQSPFYPEGEVCHVYLLHPPGGVVGGDQLAIDVEVEDGAHALLTTPASGKFYRSNGLVALQQQNLTVRKGATLEWLPQDTILFSSSHVQMNTRIDLEAGARFIGWEMLCLGRPASDELYEAGLCRQTFELWRDGEPLLIERAHFDASQPFMQQAWGMQGYTVSATLVATNADGETLKAAREIELELDEGLLSCTLMGDLLVCRLLAHQGETARLTFSRVWQEIRPLVIGFDASVPRIWNT